MKKISSVLFALSVLMPWTTLADTPVKTIAAGNEFYSWASEFIKYIKDYKEMLDIAYGICQKTKDYISNNNIVLEYNGVEYDSDSLLDCDIAKRPDVSQDEIEGLMQRCGMAAIMITENGKAARAVALVNDKNRGQKEILIANIARRQCARFNPKTITGIDITCRLGGVTRCLVKEFFDDTAYPTCCIVSDRVVDEIKNNENGYVNINTNVSYADFKKVGHDAMFSDQIDKLSIDDFDDTCNIR